MTRIIVELKGGLVQAVYADIAEPVSVDVLDWDVQENCSEEEAAEEANEIKALQAEIETMTEIY